MTEVGFRAARRDLEYRARGAVDKRVSAADALALVRDSDHVAIGGTCYSRTPMALIFELIRQGRTDLSISRPLMCYEGELLLVCGAASRIVTSWMAIGLPWGLSRVLREYVEGGRVTYDELSHLSLGLRYKAGAMGVPFLPTFAMLGSDLCERTEAYETSCPFTGEKVLLVPAINPDVALIHAHRADRHGNVQIDGYAHMDDDMARAARTVIVSVEEIVAPEVIMSKPDTTLLPHFAVDAVVEARYGAFPHECYGRYEADFEHFDAYVDAIRREGVGTVSDYIDRNVRAHADWPGFLDTVGVSQLVRQEENARALTTARVAG